jgi:hypothetical protein
MKKIILVAFLMISNVVCIAQESVVLKYNYKKGDKYVLNVSVKQEAGIAGGMNIDMKSNINIVDQTSESVKLANQIKRIKVNMLQGGKTMDFDSNMKDDELSAEGKKMKAQFAPLLKAVAYTTFDKTGKILAVTVEPSALKAQASQSPMFYSVFPKGAVKVGSTWENNQSVQGMKIKIKYTVKKITSTSVITTISGSVNLMGVDGKVTGDATFDRATGNTDQMNLNTSVNIQGMEMTLGTKATIKKVN